MSLGAVSARPQEESSASEILGIKARHFLQLEASSKATLFFSQLFFWLRECLCQALILPLALQPLAAADLPWAGSSAPAATGGHRDCHQLRENGTSLRG